MTTGTKIAIGVIGIVTGLLIVGVSKASRLKQVFDRMTIKPYGLPKNVNANLQKIEFDIDFMLQNPTADEFSLSGYVVTLKQIAVYFKGSFVGVANMAIDEIIVPAKDVTIIRNIHVVAPISSVLDNLAVLIPQLNNLNASTLNDLTFTGVVEVLGIDYQIG